MMNLPCPLILASKSPRRQQLLREAGFEFKVVTKDIDESYPEYLVTAEVAKFIAKKKSEAFKEEVRKNIVITSDTVVIQGEQVLGKPKDRDEAIEMLTLMSGDSHLVISGVCISHQSKQVIFDDITKVFFKELTLTEIEYYVDTYKPYDKAGAYGIQEWIGMIGITKIEGSYFNVVGLPVQQVYEALMQFR